MSYLKKLTSISKGVVVIRTSEDGTGTFGERKFRFFDINDNDLLAAPLETDFHYVPTNSLSA